MTAANVGLFDRAGAFALAHRLFNAPAGLVTAGLVAAWFSPELQGYYFTFVGLLTLQSFAELGLPGVLQQFASHEWARWDDPSPDVRERARARMAQLLRIGVRWYVGVAVLVGLGLGAAGTVYFAAFSPPGGADRLVIVWWAATIATAVSVLLTPLFAVLEGANRVNRVYGSRLVQAAAGRLAGWLAIILGMGLWTVPLARVATFAASVLTLVGSPLRFLRESAPRRDGRALSWSAEIRPLQGRYAVSWMSGYLLSSSFVPLLFAFQGPVPAGRMGLTLAAAAALSSTAFAPLAPRLPQLAIFAARGELEAMDALFRRAAALCLGLLSVGSIGLVLGTLAVVERNAALAARWLPPVELAMLLGAAVLQQLRFVLGSYLRAHKEEPFALLSAIEAGAAVVLLVPLAMAYGSFGMVAGYLALSAAFLGPAAMLFRRRRDGYARARTIRAPLHPARAES